MEQSSAGKVADGVGHALDREAVASDVHDGDTGDLADAALEVAVARRHDVALGRRHALDDAVVRVRALVRARQPLEPRVARNPQRHTELWPQLLELACWSRAHRRCHKKE